MRFAVPARPFLARLLVLVLVLGPVAALRADWQNSDGWGDGSFGGGVEVWVEGNRSTASSYAAMWVDDGWYARVEPWVDGGTSGPGEDQEIGYANTRQYDWNAPWCSWVTGMSNFWHIVESYWEDYGQHFPVSVDTDTCIE